MFWRLYHLAKLQGESQPNQAAINTTIDEITALKGQIMKSRADFRIKISGLLTEEQRAEFQQMHKKRTSKIGDDKAGRARKFSSEDAFGEGKKLRAHKGEDAEACQWKSMKAKKAAKAD